MRVLKGTTQDQSRVYKKGGKGLLERLTHDTVHDRMLAKEDDFSGRRDKDLALVLLACRRLDLGELDALEAAGARDGPVVVGGRGLGGRRAGDDRARGEEGALEILDQVVDVFDADAKADQVFGQAALGAEVGRDRGMAGASLSGKARQLSSPSRQKEKTARRTS